MVDGCMPFAIGSQGFGGGSAAEETTSRFNNGRGLHPADAAADVLSWCDHLWRSVAFPRKLSEVRKWNENGYSGCGLFGSSPAYGCDFDKGFGPKIAPLRLQGFSSFAPDSPTSQQFWSLSM